MFRSVLRRRRPGAAAVEAALVSPLLAYLFVIGVDFARAFHDQLILANAARNGAHYGMASPTKALDTAGMQAAALTDAGELRSTVSVSAQTGTNASGQPFVQVTVAAPFRTLSRFPGVPSPITLSQTCQMRVLPVTPLAGSAP